ncbi:MAG: biotin transporter BioY [Candidatus Cloacimonetes bacterium]|jgi:biotin transport system substrate-specific component|nr:biotin transporter BioY [Candidatus Cloacimonadota bacterium]MBT6993431.1 biotin transporter BioY [Candidatus Cloacimonadota bacterium]MBT7470037.1 biotin transporter BioY [Candidatus Cloacimonadota bacterium]
MTHSTYVELLQPSTKIRSIFYNIALVFVGSVLLTLSAKTSVLLPISPVPITLQTLVVLLLGTLFGSKRGAATVLAYIAEGAIGMPVFAKGGSGVAYLLGPTGGYLLGFVLAAFIVGYLAERGWDRSFTKTAISMLIASLSIYLLGINWLAHFVGGISKAIQVGFVPFVVGDLVKIALAVGILPTGWKLLKK